MDRPHITCSICGSNFFIDDRDTLIIKNVPDSTFVLSDKTVDIKVVECKTCGAVFQYDNTLSDDYDAVYRSIGVSSTYREQKKRQLADFISKYGLKHSKSFEWVDTNQIAIEIGCGDGQFLEIFKELGFECNGIDTSVDNYKKCIEKGITTSGIGNIFYNVVEGYYDVFFTFHYLEHLPQPIHFVENLYRILKPGGIGLIEVPNYDYIEKKNVWLEFTKDHIFYYRKRTLQYLVLKCGFEIESLEENTGGVCLTMVVRKPRKTSFRPMKDMMNRELTNFKDFIMRFDDDFAVYGAGHYSALILNSLYKKTGMRPKRIFDSNRQKCGGEICGVVVEHKDEIHKYGDFLNIVVICGIYNDEVEKMLKDMKLENVESIVKWD